MNFIKKLIYFLKIFHCVSDKQATHTHRNSHLLTVLTHIFILIQAEALFTHAVRSGCLIAIIQQQQQGNNNNITRDKAVFFFLIASRKSYWDISICKSSIAAIFEINFCCSSRFCCCAAPIRRTYIYIRFFNQVSFYIYYLLIYGMASHTQYLIAAGLLILQCVAECCLSVF